ncbi:hypothetical protein MM0350_04600 [Helicobacter pylori]
MFVFWNLKFLQELYFSNGNKILKQAFVLGLIQHELGCVNESLVVEIFNSPLIFLKSTLLSALLYINIPVSTGFNLVFLCKITHIQRHRNIQQAV